MNRYFSSIVALAIVTQVAILPATASTVRHTIGERLQRVGSQLQNAEQQGTLTVSQAEDLRRKKSDISSNAAETLNLNGSLSYADIDRFETDLNNLSEKISKSAER